MSVLIKLGCRACGTKFRFRIDTADEESPECPVCAERYKTQSRLDLSSNRAPAVRGNISRAVDLAQQVAEQDYGLTNLRDNLREGDTAAPPLTVEQRKMADAFYGGGKIAHPVHAASGFGAAPGQGWLDVARAATAHERAQGHGDAITPVIKALRKQPHPYAHATTLDETGSIVMRTRR